MPAATISSPLTDLLHAWKDGNAAALDQLLPLVHGELRRMARSRLRGVETPSLAPDDLLHEALMKLFERRPAWADRAHFFASVAMAMRSVLVDHARARMAAKRGGEWRRLTYTLSACGEEDQVADLLTLDALLRRLAEQDPRAAEILQLTYFTGLQRRDIALALEISIATVDRELRFARAWLQLGRLDAAEPAGRGRHGPRAAGRAGRWPLPAARGDQAAARSSKPGCAAKAGPRAPDPGAAEPPEHRPPARWRQHARRPALSGDGVRQRRAHRPLLQAPGAGPVGPAGADSQRGRGAGLCASAPRGPLRHQAFQHPRGRRGSGRAAGLRHLAPA